MVAPPSAAALAPQNHSVRELGSTRLQLRDDLIFMPQLEAPQSYYLVEDPLNSRFFRLGVDEYTLLSFFDGRTTLHEALGRLSTARPDHTLSQESAAALAHWLLEMDLVHTEASAKGPRLAGRAREAAHQRTLAAFNPLAIRLPFVRPDRYFEWLALRIGGLFSPLAGWIWLLLVIYGGYLVGARWQHFVESSQGVFAPGNWIWLAACWVALKLLHEAAHGVVCRRYGGAVREAGVMLVMFAPLAYVDVTSSWRFPSRLRRIHVAAAGMYVELLIASLAAVLWSRTESGWLHSLCFNVFLTAGLETVLFNANPLMKFDGYYMLSDALGIPNLADRGRQAVKACAKRWLFGVEIAQSAHRHHAGLIAAYGAAALVWSVVVSVSLAVAAATLLHGAGIVLAALAGALWLGLPLVRLAGYFCYGKVGEHPQRLRFVGAAGGMVLTLVGVFGFVPWPGLRSAPAVVEYAPLTVVRAAGPGFVREIQVGSGECVIAGQLLLVLENKELQRDLADLELQIRQCEVRARQFEQKGEIAAQQAEATQRAGLELQAAEKRAQVAQLNVRAPRNGWIVRRNLAELSGQYCREGDELLTLGDEDHKEIRLSIAQDDLDVFQSQVGGAVRIDLPRAPLGESQLAEVIPRATLQPPNIALSASNGGPLAVKNTADRSDRERPAQELLSPRFTGIVPLDPVIGRELRAGQLATVSYRPCRESIGLHLYRDLAHWLRIRLNPRPAS